MAPLPMRKLIDSNPQEARRRILGSLERADGNIAQAARSFGVHSSTVVDWLELLGLVDEVRKKYPRGRRAS